VDVEDAARSRHQLDGADARLKLFEDSRCQTDSVWPRASRNAVLDANDGSTGHEPMLSPDRELVTVPRPEDLQGAYGSHSSRRDTQMCEQACLPGARAGAADRRGGGVGSLRRVAAAPGGPIALLNGTVSSGYPLAGSGPTGETVRFIDQGTFWIAVLVRNRSAKQTVTIVDARTPEPLLPGSSASIVTSPRRCSQCRIWDKVGINRAASTACKQRETVAMREVC